MAAPTLKPGRIISFQQLCVEADPDYWDDLRQPVQYEFSNGRDFYHPLPFYDAWQFRVDDIYQGVVDSNTIG